MAHAKAEQQQEAVYTQNWVIKPDGKGVIVLTNSDLPVVRFKNSSFEFPCHDSHKVVECSAKMIGTQTSGTEPFFLRLTSPTFDGEIVIQFKFDPSFLDLFIDKATEVFFPLPVEKPIDCGIIMTQDKKGEIMLTNPCLPIVQMNVLVDKVPLRKIEYPSSSGPIQSWWPKTSRTPFFVEKDVEKEEGSVRHCTLPTYCLSVMPCHEGYVPVRCSGKIVWSHTFESNTFVILLLFSKWLKTPIYVQVSIDPSFLDQFIREENNFFSQCRFQKLRMMLRLRTALTTNP
jgi:hypothetical protein